MRSQRDYRPNPNWKRKRRTVWKLTPGEREMTLAALAHPDEPTSNIQDPTSAFRWRSDAEDVAAAEAYARERRRERAAAPLAPVATMQAAQPQRKPMARETTPAPPKILIVKETK